MSSCFGSSRWPTSRLVAIALIVNVFGLIQYGYPFGVLNLTGPVIQSFINESFIQHYHYLPSSGQISTLYGIANIGLDLGAVVGCFISGIIADKFGRKYVVYLVPSIICIISSVLYVLSYFSNSFELLLIGRLINGVGSGVACCAVPLYLAELSPVVHRGLVNGWHSSVSELCLMFGMTLGLPMLLGTANRWPYLYCLPVVPAIFGLLVTPFIPETPSFLYAIRKDTETATRVIQTYHEKHVDIDDVLDDLANTMDIITSKMTIRQIMADKGNRKALFIAICLGAGNALTGQALLDQFSTTMFSSAGFSLLMAQYLSLVPTSITIVFGIVVPFVVDRLGRRPMILCSLGIQFVGYAIYIVFGVVSTTTDFVDAVYLSIFGACLSSVGYAIGMGPVVYLVITELVPVNAAATTTTTGLMASFFSAFVVGIIYVPANDVLGPICLIPLTVVPQIVIFIIMYIEMPETKLKTHHQVYCELVAASSIRAPLLARP